MTAEDIAQRTIALRALRPAPHVPLWLQLKHALRDLVTFDLKSGDRVPSEAELGRFYGMSRITIRKAITSLADEGLIDIQHGRGSYVRAARLNEAMSDDAHFLRNGFDAAPPSQITVHSSEAVTPPDWIAQRLGIASGAGAFKIRKVLRRGRAPIAFRTSYIPVALVPNLLKANLHAPLHDTIERIFALRAESLDETIEFILADEFRAGMLDVALEHPLILIERVVRLAQGEAMECSRTFYRADQFQFRRQLHRPPGGR